jgi:hypothetical protein
MRLATSIVLPALVALSLSAQEPGLNGLWHRTHVDDIHAAIQACTADMNFITRPIARYKLTNVNPAYQKITLSITPQQVSVKLDDRNPILMPASGQEAPWTREDGDKFQVAAHLGQGQLTQTFRNDEGARTNVFHLSPDGKILTLSVTVTSPRVPKPLTYTITFGR